MTVDINYQEIDADFPVAGVDNATQGFRDNFTVIKDSLGVAKTELENLQAKVVLKEPLTVDGTVNNNFAGIDIIEANLVATTEELQILNLNTETPTGVIDFNQGSYCEITINGLAQTTLTFNNWPTSGKYAKVRVKIRNTSNISTNVTFGFTPGDPVYSVDFPDSIVVPASGDPLFFDFWIDNEGGVIYGKFLGGFGTTTFPTKFQGVNEVTADSSSIDLTTTTTYFAPIASWTAILNPGAEGQVKTLALASGSESMVVTVTVPGWTSGSTTGTITFNALGQACTLQVINGRWYCVGNNGCTFG